MSGPEAGAIRLRNLDTRPVSADPDPLLIETRRRARQVRYAATGLVMALIVLVVASIGIGAVAISPGDVFTILASRLGIVDGTTVNPHLESVLLAIRLPRVLLSLTVGCGLAISGALMQGLFRNPLADPSLVGVSSGAAFGAASAIVLGSSIVAPTTAAILGPAVVMLSAFCGGLVATLIVYRFATKQGRTSVTTMLLAGIAINALCQAGVGSFVLFADDAQLRDLTFWTLGSLGGATWGTLAIAVPLVGSVVAAAPSLARALNALLLGESEAQHLGIRTQHVKRIVVVLAALAVGGVTAIVGVIGFVGLVAPHLVRLVLGPDHRALLPISALTGAVLLVGADLISRVLLAPVEIPIGIVTAFAGAPFFLWLLLRERPA